MVSSIWHGLIYDPLYNALVFLIGALPSHDVGLAVIGLTLIVRVVLFPLSKRASETQEKMRAVAPELEALKEKHKNDREKESRAMLALYKERGIHPFSNFALLLVQIPILLALYFIFALGGLPEVNGSLLYSFVPAIPLVNMEFLGFLDMGGKSILLALLAGLTQVVYTRLSMGPRKKHAPGASFGGDLAHSFDLQARYVLPLFIAVFAVTLPAAAPLYWVTSNAFMIAQELLIRKKR